MKILMPIKNPEATYGSILIFISTFLALFSMIARPLYAPAYPSTELIFQVSLFFITGILLQFKKKHYWVGQQNLILFLIGVAGAYLNMLNGAISGTTEDVVIYIYFGLFFVMNLMIILRVAREKRLRLPQGNNHPES